MQKIVINVQFYQHNDQKDFIQSKINKKLIHLKQLNLLSQIQKPSGLNKDKMPLNIDVNKLLELYKSGRYECDIWFYENLLQLVNELEIFELIPKVEENLKHVRKIHQLTLQNSDSLNEEFDEDQAVLKAEEMKKEIKLIKVDEIIKTMEQIQKQGFKSYSQHCAQLIKKYNYHPKYVDVVKNIINTVYDPKLKAEQILMSTLFMIRNTDKIEEVISIYDKAIQNGLLMMKQLRKKLPQCNLLVDKIEEQMQVYYQLEEEGELKQSDYQLMQKLNDCLNAIKKYCQGTYFIYLTLQKIAEITKILEQKNNYTLKLNSFKPEFEKTVSLYKRLQMEDHDILEVEQRISDLPIKELKGMFMGEKGGVQKISRCCRICLRFVLEEDGVNGLGDYHKICQQVIKQLISFNNQVKH